MAVLDMSQLMGQHGGDDLLVTLYQFDQLVCQNYRAPRKGKSIRAYAALAKCQPPLWHATGGQGSQVTKQGTAQARLGVWPEFAGGHQFLVDGRKSCLTQRFIHRQWRGGHQGPGCHG